MTQKPASLFDWNIVGPAIGDAFKKLHPRLMVKNPVMFVTMVGAALTTAGIFTAEPGLRGFVTQLAIWLWFTVLFANFAEAVAEGRGKAQAASLRRARKDTIARRLRNGREEKVPAPALQKGDLVVCEAGDIIPADGDVVEGIASVDEAAITGESAPVIRESGGDRSAVTGGTRVLSDRIVIRVTADKGSGFLDKMIALVEGARRQKTPNEIALIILLAALTFIFLLVCVTLKSFGIYSATNFSVPVLIALLVCLIPTTIGGLLSAIGIAGMDRVLQRNVLAMSGRAVEAAGDVDVLLLDKTGTITLGNRMATAFLPAPNTKPERLAEIASARILINGQPLTLPVEPVLRLIALAAALLVSLASGAGMMADWQTLALYWYGAPEHLPASAQQIYARLPSPHKQLLWKERNRHVIVSPHDADVHRDILTFLQHQSPLGVPPPPP